MSSCISVTDSVFLFTIHYFGCAITNAWGVLRSFSLTGQLCCCSHFHYSASTYSFCPPTLLPPKGFNCISGFFGLSSAKKTMSPQWFSWLTNTLFSFISQACSWIKVSVLIIAVTVPKLGTFVILWVASLLRLSSKYKNLQQYAAGVYSYW